MVFGGTTGDVAVCDSLPEYTAGGPVKKICYAKAAEAKKDLSICLKIDATDTESRVNCYVNIAVAKKDPSICKSSMILNSTDSEPNIRNCYMTVAKATNDSSICNNINLDYIKKGCIDWVEKNISPFAGIGEE